MPDLYTTATLDAVLLAGRAPVWSIQPDAAGSTTPPDSGIDGIALQGAVRTLVDVAFRAVAHARSARLSISVLDLTCVYTVTIDGTAVAYDATADGAANMSDVINGIADAINANGTVNLIVEATVNDDDDEVLVRGIVEADWSIDFTEDSGATLLVEADPVGVTLQVWWLPDSRPDTVADAPRVWKGPADARYLVDRRGFLERYDTGGIARCFAQVFEHHGHAGDGAVVTYADRVISIGPCLIETGY